MALWIPLAPPGLHRTRPARSPSARQMLRALLRRQMPSHALPIRQPQIVGAAT